MGAGRRRPGSALDREEGGPGHKNENVMYRKKTGNAVSAFPVLSFVQMRYEIDDAQLRLSCTAESSPV